MTKITIGLQDPYPMKPITMLDLQNRFYPVRSQFADDVKADEDEIHKMFTWISWKTGMVGIRYSKCSTNNPPAGFYPVKPLGNTFQERLNVLRLIQLHMIKFPGATEPILKILCPDVDDRAVADQIRLDAIKNMEKAVGSEVNLEINA